MTIPSVLQGQPDPSYTLSLYDLEGNRVGSGNELLLASNIRFSKVFNGPGDLSFAIPKRFEDDAFQWVGCEVRLVRDDDEANPLFTGIVEKNSVTVGQDLLQFQCPGLEVLLEDQVVTWTWQNLDVSEVAFSVMERFVNSDREWMTATYPGTIQQSGYGVHPTPAGGTTIRADKQRPRDILDTCARLAGSWAYRVEKVDGVNTLILEPPPSIAGYSGAIHHDVRGFQVGRDLQSIVTGLIADGGKDASGNPLTTIRENPDAIAAYKGRRSWERIANSQITSKADLIQWAEQELAYRTNQLKQGTFYLVWRHYDSQNRLQIVDPRTLVPNMLIRVFDFDADPPIDENLRASRFDFDIDRGTITVRFGIRHDYLAQRFQHAIDELRHNESDRTSPVYEVRTSVPPVRHLFGSDFPARYHWGLDHFFGVTNYAPRNDFSHRLTFTPGSTEVTV